jgi:hypothetical protein
MADVPIQNETEYSLTNTILDQIKRDAQEYFGDSLRSIRVQYGIDRHAFNARTGEMRYAFSPGDFGLVDTTVSFPDAYLHRDVPRIDDDTEDVLDESAFDDVDVEADDAVETSLESLAEDLDDVDEEEETRFTALSDDFEDEEIEDENKDFLYDDEYE